MILLNSEAPKAIQQRRANVHKTYIDPTNVQGLPVDEHVGIVAGNDRMIFEEPRPEYYWKRLCFAVNGAGNPTSLVAEARMNISQIE
jgi:hypothetical protein